MNNSPLTIVTHRLTSLLALLLVPLVLAACATPQVRGTDDGDRIFESMPAALSALKPTGELSPGGSARLVITEKKSPLLKQGGLNHRFELLELKGRKDQPFIFTTLAVCDCLGFRKWAVAASVSLLDQNGQSIATDSPGRDPQSRQLTGVFPADARYYLLVVADRTFEGRRMGSVTATGMSGLPIMDIAMTVHATGDVIVQWIAPK